MDLYLSRLSSTEKQGSKYLRAFMETRMTQAMDIGYVPTMMSVQGTSLVTAYTMPLHFGSQMDGVKYSATT